MNQHCFCFIFRFGKTARGPSQYGLVRFFEIPKWWFLHFYIFSSIYIPLLWGACLGVYFLEIPAPNALLQALDFFTNTNRREGTSAEACFLAR